MQETGAVVDARGDQRVGNAAPVRMSERLWGLQWPSWTYEGIAFEPTTFDVIAPFIGAHYPSIFATEPNRFFEEKMTPAKRRFLAESDMFAYRADGEIIGVWMGHPSDWATYYARSMAILPEYRERGLFLEFFKRLANTLRDAGVERIEADVSPANPAVNRGMLRLGWLVSSTVNSDRWGAMLRYTKFLTPEPERVFRQQYIIAPKLKGRE